MTGFSALPLADEGGGHDDGTHLAGESKILGPRWLRLPTLTVGLLGVQVLWSVEMSYGTPYLISLGLSKSAVAMVFLAGPISGLIVQPLIGVLADNSKSRFGRRRPYMLLGVVICMSAMLLLGFTRPFATWFTSAGSPANHVLTIWLAIFALFSIDFSINAVQAVDRALLVDTLPTSDQPDGNAWAARMLGFGSVAGYFVGNVDMTKVLPFLGNTELEVLSVVGAFLLLVTHLVMAYCVKEKVVVGTKRSEKSFRNELRELWDNALSLPPAIRQICFIQFFAWMGWFPLLFNTTEFIAELHKRSHPSMDPDLALEEGTRLGSRAMFYNSILSLVANILLPFFVSEAKSRQHMQDRLSGTNTNVWVRWFNKLKIHLASLWALSHFVFAVCMGATFFYRGVWGATFFTTVAGFSWAITQWAPFALLAEAILTADGDSEEVLSIHLGDARATRPSLEGQDHERQFLVGNDPGDGVEDEVRSFRSSTSMDRDGEESDRDRERDRDAKRRALMGNADARQSYLDVRGGAGPSDFDSEVELGKKKGDGLAAKAGIIIGIHNIFIVMPQFVITGLSSIIFAIMNTGGGDEAHAGVPPAVNSTATTAMLEAREGMASGGGPESYAVIFRIGGFAAVVAFVLTVKLARHLRHQ